jgi:acetyl esterase/lipase
VRRLSVAAVPAPLTVVPVLLTAVLALLTACTSSRSTSSASTAPRSSVQGGITFASYELAPGVRVHARTVAGRTHAPWVVYVHGGSWLAGRGNSPGGDAWARHVVPRGYQVFALDYRLSRTATWPAQRMDVARAVDWIRARAGTFGLDVARAVIVGESAGGHLAAIEASRGRFAGAVDLAGVVDPQAALTASTAELGEAATRLIGCEPTVCPARWRDAQAIAHVGVRTPPFLVLHSADDPIVPLAISTAFVDGLRAAGRRVVFHVVPGRAHGLLGNTGVLRRVDAFMDAASR